MALIAWYNMGMTGISSSTTQTLLFIGRVLLATWVMQTRGIKEFGEVCQEMHQLWLEHDSGPVQLEGPIPLLATVEQVGDLRRYGSNEAGLPLEPWELERAFVEVSSRSAHAGLLDVEAQRDEIVSELRSTRRLLWKDYLEGERKSPAYLSEIRHSLELETNILGLKSPAKILHAVGRFGINEKQSV